MTMGLFLLGCGAGPPTAEVSDSLRSHVATRAVNNERLIEPAAVDSFYRARQFRTAWDTHDVSDIVVAIQGVSADGLTPADYHLDAIETLRKGTERLTSAKAAADLDILLTDAVAGMVDHLRYGKVKPSTLNASWNVDPRKGAPPLSEELTKVAGGGSVARAMANERPQHLIYRGLMDALARYRQQIAAGGWGDPVPDGKSIKPGGIDRRIPAIRARLRASGDLAAGSRSDSTRYDPALVKAVKAFQEAHRQDPNGVIDADLVKAMNVTAEERANQVRANLERARWVLNGLGDDFLLVNLPAFKAYLIRGGRNVWESRTQIGDEAMQTPTFRAEMKTIVLNPDWTVPPTILAEEVLPAMQRGENYLAQKKLVVLDANNQEVDPKSIDWQNATPQTFPYTLRQPPDEENALGKVKFLFPNPYSIYLHDTPARTLFNAETRTFSHGCIRIEHPLELAQLLLQGQSGWDAGRIQKTLDSGDKVDINLEHTLPVLIVYWTVSVGASGVHTNQDIYNLDAPLLAELNARPR
jgi:murein L,D-transpeptidase YcbB/YkuD